MIRTLLLGLVLVIAAADGASAQGRSTYGFGDASCGDWLQSRTAKDINSYQLQAYVAGFLSGYNFAFTGPDFLAGKASDKGASFYLWIDKYCRDKPIDILMQAMVALRVELQTRAR